MMKTAIVFDLDNTLITTHKRHYQVYKFLVLSAGKNPISLQDYLTIRVKHAANNAFILEHLHSLTDKRLKSAWLKFVEAPEYLKYDERIVDLRLLKRLSFKHELILLSLRSKRGNAIDQIDRLGLSDIFHYVEFVKHDRLMNPKIHSLKKMKTQYQIHAFVGDSLEDYQASAKAKVPFVGVDTGLLKLPQNITLYATINHYLQTFK